MSTSGICILRLGKKTGIPIGPIRGEIAEYRTEHSIILFQFWAKLSNAVLHSTILTPLLTELVEYITPIRQFAPQESKKLSHHLMEELLYVQ